MKIVTALCNECKKETSVYSNTNRMMYFIPNCKHHGKIKDNKKD